METEFTGWDNSSGSELLLYSSPQFHPLILERAILGDPGADGEDEGKSKRATKKIGEENSRARARAGSRPRSRLFFADFFRRPFRLSLAPTICPWVSEDGNVRSSLRSILRVAEISNAAHELVLKRMTQEFLEITRRRQYVSNGRCKLKRFHFLLDSNGEISRILRPPVV